MNDQAMFYLENITREAFSAGLARGLYEATASLHPAQTQRYYEETKQVPPRDVEAYLDTIKAGLIMRNSGMR